MPATASWWRRLAGPGRARDSITATAHGCRRSAFRAEIARLRIAGKPVRRVVGDLDLLVDQVDDPVEHVVLVLDVAVQGHGLRAKLLTDAAHGHRSIPWCRRSRARPSGPAACSAVAFGQAGWLAVFRPSAPPSTRFLLVLDRVIAYTVRLQSNLIRLEFTLLMRAITYKRYGAPSSSERTTTSISRTIGDKDVLVKVRAAALHVGDRIQRPRLTVPGAPVDGPTGPEARRARFRFAGQVEAVGSAVTRFQGSATSCLALARVRAPNSPSAAEDDLVGKPANLTFEQAASIPTSALAALHGLRRWKVAGRPEGSD